MDFSEPLPLSLPNRVWGRVAAYSPCGTMLATVDDMRVAVRMAESLDVVRLCECCDLVQNIEWSFDSKYLMCVMLLRARIWVFPVHSEIKNDIVQAPVVKIDEGICGLTWSQFAPDGVHILTCCQFNIRLTVWDILSKQHHYIKQPKNCEQALDFDHNGVFMAVAHRENFIDSIRLYSCRTWTQINMWNVGTVDLNGLRFSPNGHFLCTWDGPLNYNIFVYAVPKGHCLMSYCAYDDALAIKTVTWSPNSMFLSIGSFDQRVRLIDYLSWKVICEHSHLCKSISSASVTIYSEILSSKQVGSQYASRKAPFQIPEVSPDPEKDNPKFGIGLMEWSHHSEYLATRNDNQPTCVFIWATQSLSLICVLLHVLPVRSFSWSPLRPHLMIVTDNARLFTWTPGGAACITIPTEHFKATSCLLNPKNDSMLILSKTQGVACFLVDSTRSDG